jgi:hypothetical protein
MAWSGQVWRFETCVALIADQPRDLNSRCKASPYIEQPGPGQRFYTNRVGADKYGLALSALIRRGRDAER